MLMPGWGTHLIMITRARALWVEQDAEGLDAEWLLQEVKPALQAVCIASASSSISTYQN